MLMADGGSAANFRGSGMFSRRFFGAYLVFSYFCNQIEIRPTIIKNPKTMNELKTVKKEYQRPTIRFESLHHGLLTTSGEGMGKRDSYEATDDNPFGGSNGARNNSVWDANGDE